MRTDISTGQCFNFQSSFLSYVFHNSLNIVIENAKDVRYVSGQWERYSLEDALGNAVLLAMLGLEEFPQKPAARGGVVTIGTVSEVAWGRVCRELRIRGQLTLHAQ